MEENSWQQISDLNLWDQSLSLQKQANFLQSSSFGQFHEKLGNKVWRFGKFENQKLRSFAQVIKLKTKFSQFLYLPWGPLLEKPAELEPLVKLLERVGIEEGANFIRLDPREEIAQDRSLNLKIAASFTQPQSSLILDLTKSLEEIRSNLSESTRYNIGWVERQGVKVTTSEQPEDIKIFLNLLRETAGRHQFSLYENIDYYRQQFLSFSEKKAAKLFIAQGPDSLNNIPLASALVIYFGDTATYLHAASSSKHPKLRAPYLMQWKIIEDAKNSGFKNYDFWGVSKDDNPTDPWAGVTAFKKSFGGERVQYQKPYDLILKKGYYFDIFIEKIRKPLRKLVAR